MEKSEKFNKKYLAVGLLIVSILLFALIIGFGLGSKNRNQTPEPTPTPTVTQTPTLTQSPTPTVTPTVQQLVLWNGKADSSWAPNSTPPECEEPLVINSPVDVSLVVSMLYPGQTRGGDFKPHGGFRLDKPTNKADITLPRNAYLYRGSRYYQDGEIQYLLDFIDPCGIMMRFDHLLTLTPEFNNWINKLPEAKANDTRTTFFNPPTMYDAGTLIATEVGFRTPLNVGFDLGVYDLRKPNEKSKESAWAAQHSNESETAFYAICWIENLPEPDRTTIKALPGSDQIAGKTSDYCN